MSTNLKCAYVYSIRSANWCQAADTVRDTAIDLESTYRVVCLWKSVEGFLYLPDDSHEQGIPHGLREEESNRRQDLGGVPRLVERVEEATDAAVFPVLIIIVQLTTGQIKIAPVQAVHGLVDNPDPGIGHGLAHFISSEDLLCTVKCTTRRS